MPRRKSKKRPCRICRKWFMPNPRVGDRQKTCGDDECMRKWHAKKCAEWNQKNSKCAQENYLQDKLALALSQNDGGKKPSAADDTANSQACISRSVSFPKLPRSLIQEVMGVQQFVIIEHITQQLFKTVQEVIGRQQIENTEDSPQLLSRCSSRGDSFSRGP